MFAINYPLFDVFVSTLYIALFIFWIVVVFHVMIDLFRSDDLDGPLKALWVLLIFVLPLVGALVYLVVRGGSMHQRRARAPELQHQALEDYIRTIANTKE